MELVESTTATKDLVQWTENKSKCVSADSLDWTAESTWIGVGPNHTYRLMYVESPGPGVFPVSILRDGKNTRATNFNRAMDLAELAERGDERANSLFVDNAQSRNTPSAAAATRPNAGSSGWHPGMTDIASPTKLPAQTRCAARSDPASAAMGLPDYLPKAATLGPGSGGGECAKCGAWWTEYNTAHCGAEGCHRTFTGITAFDAHRDGSHSKDIRRCVLPESVGLFDAGRAYPCWGLPGGDPRWGDD